MGAQRLNAALSLALLFFGVCAGVATATAVHRDVVTLPPENRDRIERVRTAYPGQIAALKLLDTEELRQRAEARIVEIREMYRAHEQRLEEREFFGSEEDKKRAPAERARLLREFNENMYDEVMLLIDELKSRLPLRAQDSVIAHGKTGPIEITETNVNDRYTTRIVLGFAGQIEQYLRLLPRDPELALCSD
jgi:hypothetical protein